MTALDRTWSESFIWHMRQIPYLLLHMRQIVESTVSAQTLEGRITGSSEKARLPYRVEPADDADQLWAELIEFAKHALDHVGGMPSALSHARSWQGARETQGLPSQSATEAYSAASGIVRWLEACTPTIERTPDLHDTVDTLSDTIRRMRARYPTPPRFPWYLTRKLCPVCEEGALEVIHDIHGFAGYRCKECEQCYDRNWAETEGHDWPEYSDP